MRLFILLAPLVFISCSQALHTKVNDQIRLGDSKEHVFDVLGEPRESQVEKNKEKYAWAQKKDVCVIQIEEDAVTSSQCYANPNYVSPTAAFFSGFANGYNSSLANRPAPAPIAQPQQPINCTTQHNSYTGTSYTNCY